MSRPTPIEILATCPPEDVEDLASFLPPADAARLIAAVDAKRKH